MDDNAVNRRILREMLTNWQMQPTVVASGAAAIVEMLQAARAGNPFPLVILDGMMPEMDGFMVVEKIREHAELSGATVMMLTSAMPCGAAARCGDLGVASYLTKPVTQSELLDAILVAFGDDFKSTQADQAESTGNGAQPIARLRILLAEDNIINRAVASRTLEKLGHTLIHAADGVEAVEAYKENQIDLVLMDIQMPEMDGFEATRAIRQIQAATGRRAPIVAMTAHAMAGDRERCLSGGMDDYISKPMRRDDLFRVLKSVTSNDMKTQNAENEEEPAAEAILNSREELLEQCDGDEDLLAKLVELFQKDTPEIVAAIREAVERSDALALTSSAHKLLSSVGAFGAARARGLAFELEEQGRQSDFNHAAERLERLEEEMDRIYAALADYGAVLV